MGDMDAEKTLLLEFSAHIQAELSRIGWDDSSANGPPQDGWIPMIGFNRPFTRESLSAVVAELRTIPSDVGWRGVFAHFGVDPTPPADSDDAHTT